MKKSLSNKNATVKKPKYKQFDCIESEKLDLRQAKAVLKYNPDIVILEYPNNNVDPGIELNNYSPLDKPKKLVDELLAPLSPNILAIHPWAQSDMLMWQNIVKLWSENKQVLVYKVDGPPDLTSEWLEVWNHMYPCAKKNWVWWVQIYLRERIMANNIQNMLDGYEDKPDPTILIFLQSFHWDHVRFLLTQPTKEEIWQYYFGNFSKEITQKTIVQKIQKLNPVFYSYWQRFSDFKD